MIKLLILTQWDMDATYAVRIDPLFHLGHADIQVSRKPYQGDITFSYFESYTHLFMERPSGTHDLNVIKLAKQRGLKILLDFDDDVLHVFETNPMHQHYEQCKSVILECLTLADEIWVSTRGCAKSFQMFNRNIHVIPNAWDDRLMPTPNTFNPETKIALWRGGGSHEADVYEQSELLVDVMNSNPDWLFVFLGFRFIYLEQRCKNIIVRSPMPLMQYYEFLHKLRPNIVFHPLSVNKFNESKSNLCFLEATWSGAAFFGNTKLPEFNNALDISNMGNMMREDLSAFQHESWNYITQNLFLSDINTLRIERLLAI